MPEPTLSVRQLQSVTIDLVEQTVTACFDIPTTGGSLSFVSEKTLDPNSSELDQTLSNDTREYLQLLVASIKNPAGAKDCDTCTGNCCKTFDVIEVTPEDIVRFHDAGLDGRKYVDMYGAETAMGTVGQMSLDDKKKCVALDMSGRCTIYQHRPQACRDFSASDCDIYEPDIRKKHHLKVVP